MEVSIYQGRSFEGGAKEWIHLGLYSEYCIKDAGNTEKCHKHMHIGRC